MKLKPYIYLKKIILWGILILLGGELKAQNYPIQIRAMVLDEATQKPLSFVHIVRNDARTKGKTSDISGYFVVNAQNPTDSFTFSFVGYEKEIRSAQELYELGIVQLKPKSLELSEITVLPGPNPALRIIEAAIDRRHQNNPNKLPHYQYKAYHKFKLRIDPVEDDRFARLSKSAPGSKADSNYLKTKTLSDSMHFFLMENVSQKKYRKPKNEYEEVIANRVSGFKNPSFFLLANQLQSFGFYENYVELLDISFLNPLAPGSTKKYDYEIKDTLFDGSDSIFVIAYEVLPGKNIDGLQGLLYIHTDGFALQSVIAKPHNNATLDQDLAIEIKQNYQKQGGQWFPKELYADITFKSLTMDGFSLKGYANSRIDSVDLNTPLKNMDFPHYNLTLTDGLDGESQYDLLERYRPEPLDRQDSVTYRIVDSLGEQMKFDRYLTFAEHLTKGYIPFKFLNIPFDQLFRYNQFEGIRLGIGLETNQKLSRYFSLGGYIAYGFRDQRSKFGTHFNLLAPGNPNFKLQVGHQNDVMEVGGRNYYKNRPNLLSGETDMNRTVNIQMMDYFERNYVSLEYRFFKYFQTQWSLNDIHKTVASDYRFAVENANGRSFLQSYRLTTAALGLRFAYKERIFRYADGFEQPSSTPYPVLLLNITKGFDDLHEGQFDFWKIEGRLSHDFTFRNFGKSRLQINGGYLNNDLPYGDLFGAVANGGALNIYAGNSFQNMMMNEFFMMQYASAHWTHTFGSLLFKTKYSEPKIRMVNSALWGYHPHLGQSDSGNRHFGFGFSDARDGFYETGLVLDELLVSLNLGAGVFYRYGPYSYDSSRDNFRFVLSATANF